MLYFLFYKKDEEESSPSPSPSNQGNSPSPSPSPSPSKEDKLSVKITDDGVYIPDLPKKESYTQNEMPCDDTIDEGETIPLGDTVKAWCDDLGIPINQKYEVVGYSYDDLIDMNNGPQDGRTLFTKDKNIGCKYGGDKKGCVYVEKREAAASGDGNIIGIQNYKGDNFLENFWDGLQTHTKMSDFFMDEIFKQMEIKVENNKLHARPIPTTKNCAKFTGKWITLKPGINIPTVVGMQYTLLFLHSKGYPKDQLKFDININALS